MQQQRSRDRRFLVPVALLLMTSLSDTISANAILLGGDNRWEAVNDNQAGPSINHGVPGSYWHRPSVLSGSVSHGVYCDLFIVIRRTTEVYPLASNVTKMVPGSSIYQGAGPSTNYRRSLTMPTVTVPLSTMVFLGFPLRWYLVPRSTRISQFR